MNKLLKEIENDSIVVIAVYVILLHWLGLVKMSFQNHTQMTKTLCKTFINEQCYVATKYQSKI